MSGRRSLQDQVSSLTSELELSAFLNKGVLQTNSEYKLRIAELERENAVLRTAEARLSRTEDMLETARAQLASHEASIHDLEDELKGEASARSVIERERDEWRNRFKRILERSREYIGVVEALDVEIKEKRPTLAPSAIPPSPQASMSLRKRKRVQPTYDEESDIEPSEQTPTPPHRRLSQNKKTKSPFQWNNRHNPVQPNTNAVHPSTTPHRPPSSTRKGGSNAHKANDEVKVKAEFESPQTRREIQVFDSDDDPLAMN